MLVLDIAQRAASLIRIADSSGCYKACNQHTRTSACDCNACHRALKDKDTTGSLWSARGAVWARLLAGAPDALLGNRDVHPRRQQRHDHVSAAYQRLQLPVLSVHV
eukprot:2419930-Rhodomonas_salina.2